MRKSPLQGVLVQCSLLTEKLSPSYVIKLLWPSIPQTPLLLHHSEARRDAHTTTETWLSQSLLPEACKDKVLTKCLRNDCVSASPAAAAAAAAKSLQSCLTLCDPIDGSPPGSPVPGILQVKTLEWAAISFSKAWKWKMKVKSLSRVRLFATPWTAGYQAPPSMGFSRQEYWNGVPLPSPLFHLGFPNDSAVKNLPAMQETQETWVPSLGKIPWRKWQPTPVFLPGTSHGHRGLAGYSPWGSKS